MNVQNILNGKKAVIDFLKEKGLEEEKNYADHDYNEGVYFTVGINRLLVVYETTEESLKEIKDHFLIDRGLSYFIAVMGKKMLFLRSFGEPKYFLYTEKSRNVISKVDRLNQIDAQGFDFIFQAGKDISAIFYEDFKLKRDLFVQHIENDFQPIEKYLLAQKIFDRVFFIYFLCHKGIIKVDQHDLSGKSLFEIILQQNDFFQTLKTIFKRFNTSGLDRTLNLNGYQLHIPYLNGGLFRPDATEDKLKISLSKDEWRNIFDFLNSFHWIIEDLKVTEESGEKILTPEILGHVYERSVVEWEIEGMEKEAEKSLQNTTERKRKGVYYTPEYITNYISSDAITCDLLNKLENKYQSIDELIKNGSNVDKEKAITLLRNMKILDPACGSGAFLIKSAEIIFNLERRLNYSIKRRVHPFNLKLDIITDNIYGVDLLTGATEISKLRLWLWLISDYQETVNEIKPLPNIEYNLRVGNTLVGWLNEKLQQVPFFTPLTPAINQTFEELSRTSDHDDRVDIKQAQVFLEKYILENYIEAYYLLNKIYKKTHGERAEDLRKILETIRRSIYASITPSFLQNVNTSIKSNFDKKNPPITLQELEDFSEFHWRMDFGHILQNGGFDLVIGNPPYVNMQTMAQLQKWCQYKYPSIYTGQNDLLYYFVQRGLDLLKEGGKLNFIVSRYFLESSFASKFREYIARESKINGILDFNNFQVFGTDVNVLTCIILLSRESRLNEMARVIKVKEWTDEGSKLMNEITKHEFSEYDDEYLDIFSIKQSELNAETWSLNNPRISRIKQNIKLNSQPLSDLCFIGQGMTTGLNEAYVVDPEIASREKLEKKFLRNYIKTRDLKKYAPLNRKLKIIYIPEKIDLKEAQNIIEHLAAFKSSLKERYDFVKGHCEWYSWGNLRNREFFERKVEKIITPLYSTSNKFVYDSGNTNQDYMLLTDAYVIVPKNIETSMKYVLAILNSKLIEFYFKHTAKLKRDGYYEYSSGSLSKMPIKIEKQYSQQLENLVDKIIEARQQLNSQEKGSVGCRDAEEIYNCLQEKINDMVFKIYNISNSDREAIEKEFN